MSVEALQFFGICVGAVVIISVIWDEFRKH